MTKDDKKKDGFVLYASQYESIEDLTNEQKGILLDAIFKHVLSIEMPPIEDGEVRMAFKFIKGQIDRDSNRYEEICARRREYGKRGAEAKGSISKQKVAYASISKQKQASEADKDKDKDKDKEQDKDIGTGELYNKGSIKEPPLRPPLGGATPVDDILEENLSLREQVDELERENAELRSKDDKPKKEELDLSIVSDEMRPIVDDWLAYKRQKRQSYKARGFAAFYKKLLKDCGGDPNIAKAMVENSKANNYDGLFPLKKSYSKELPGQVIRDEKREYNEQDFFKL